MADQDDFDEYSIVEEAPRDRNPRSRRWFWAVLAIALVLLAFASGMALVTLLNRVGDDETSPVVLPTVTNTPLANVISATAVALSTPTLTVASMPTPLPAVTATLTPSPTPVLVCSVPVSPDLAALYDRTELGCATGNAGIVWSAWESFERGSMLWRSDNDRAYVFFDDGLWSTIDERWDDKPIPSRGEPPAGLQAPLRGFGYAWGVRDDLFERLGWATGGEQGFCALIQSFDQGFILQSNTVEFCRESLYNYARDPSWTPLAFAVAADGRWRTVGGEPAQARPVQSEPTQTAPVQAGDVTPPSLPPGSVTRPLSNGLFVAPQVETLALDAVFDDWPNGWSPINAVVQGPENYAGAQDLSGEFQAAWTPAGLALTIRVNDDQYRSGPNGTDMWQGDGFEIHLDRALSADFDSVSADADDYQVGVSFGPDLSELRLYRWLPLEKEGEFRISGAVASTDQGYQAEFILPLALFDLSEADWRPGQTFGFNVSINDNDGDSPAQQSVLSASAQRATYNNPTQWGTLVLGE